jgi:uncharacterized heparinase superfamily protein
VNLSRYWHTVRYLQFRQIAGRPWFHLRRPSPDLRPAPARRPARRQWTSAGWRPATLSAPTTATFLNVTASLAEPAVWQDSSRGALWLYNLHYFDDLDARDAGQRRAWHDDLVMRWVRENPPAAGAGWTPYPASLRIANWIKWILASPADGVSRPDILTSLAVQTRWLSKRVEFHILANHLWANGKALLMAGAFFTGPEADAWRERGLQIISAELDEQILADGGHFERSPMYHAIVLEDMIDLLQLASVYDEAMPSELVSRLKDVASRMLHWLRVMTHPDGEISFFNDAAFGIAPPLAALETYARTVGVAVSNAPLSPLESLRESGYVRLTNGRAVVLCDVAPVGPDYQPAHAHADTLSFELSLDGRRVIVNGGTSTYAAGGERARQRGTAAHNTVEVDGRNSSDVWAGFRVGRRARVLEVRTEDTDGVVEAAAAHDGYSHTPGQVIHRREWRLEPERLVVTDILTGRYGRATARLLLHPDAAPSHGDCFRLSTTPPAAVAEKHAAWHPRFGVAQDTRVIEIDLAGARTATTLTWG